MKHAPVDFQAALPLKACGCKHHIWSSQPTGGQACHTPKEKIHHLEDQTAAQATNTCLCGFEISQEPCRPGPGCPGDFGDELLKLVLPKTVEEETGDDQIKSGWRRAPN